MFRCKLAELSNHVRLTQILSLGIFPDLTRCRSWRNFLYWSMIFTRISDPDTKDTGVSPVPTKPQKWGRINKFEIIRLIVFTCRQKEGLDSCLSRIIYKFSGIKLPHWCFIFKLGWCVQMGRRVDYSDYYRHTSSPLEPNTKRMDVFWS